MILILKDIASYYELQQILSSLLEACLATQDASVSNGVILDRITELIRRVHGFLQSIPDVSGNEVHIIRLVRILDCLTDVIIVDRCDDAPVGRDYELSALRTAANEVRGYLGDALGA